MDHCGIGERNGLIDRRATRRVTVAHPGGLHARPAVAVAKKAGQFVSQVRICRGSRVADARSPLELMSLGVPQGEEVLLVAEGPDAQEATEVLEELFTDEFGMGDA